MSEENKDLGDMAEDAMDNAEKKAENLGDKAKDTFDSGKQEKKDFGDKASEKFDDAKKASKEFAEDAKEKVSEMGEKAGEKFDDAKEATKEFAEDAKEAAGEFADDAKKTANEFTAGAKDAFNTGSGENKKLLAGILAIVLGWLGVHKFILGYQKEGIIMAVVGVAGWFLCGIPTMLVSIVGLVEGIMYLTKSDEEFYNTYQKGRKPWF